MLLRRYHKAKEPTAVEDVQNEEPTAVEDVQKPQRKRGKKDESENN